VIFAQLEALKPRQDRLHAQLVPPVHSLTKMEL